MKAVHDIILVLSFVIVSVFSVFHKYMYVSISSVKVDNYFTAEMIMLHLGTTIFPYNLNSLENIFIYPDIVETLIS